MSEVECEFSHVGCQVKLVREEMEQHLSDNLQTHLLLMSKGLQEEAGEKTRRIEQLEGRLEERARRIQEQFEVKEKQLQRQFEQITKENEKLREELHNWKDGGRQPGGEQHQGDETMVVEDREQKEHETSGSATEQDRQIQALASRLESMEKLIKEELQKKASHIREVDSKIAQLETHIHKTGHQLAEVRGRTGILPYFLSMHNFHRLKSTNSYWTSPPLYTHPGGYKLCIRVYPSGIGPSGSSGTQTSVELCSMKGDNDDRLKWPADCSVTLQLLNQHRDQDHVTVCRRFQWHKPSTAYPWKIGWFTHELVAYKDLERNARKQTHYLKNDSLVFKITKIDVHVYM